MVRIYYHDNKGGDQRLPHEGELVTPDALRELGVFAANIPDQAEVDRLAEGRGYKNRDEVSVLWLLHCAEMPYRFHFFLSNRQLFGTWGLHALGYGIT
jgi:cupin superfamily acireductone dioxygenase involved in methionine salvage